MIDLEIIAAHADLLRLLDQPGEAGGIVDIAARLDHLLADPALTDPGLRDLLERARFDLEHGWTAAAYDALGRALRLLDPDPDLGTDAASSRPAERAVLRAAAVELAARGLTPLDIATALRLTEAAVRDLFRTQGGFHAS
jgi:hypothetical protein